MKKLLFILIYSLCFSQSFEIMPGNEKLFIDAQWFKTFESNKQFSLFSRTRATDDYQNNTDLFTGSYINYTTKAGIGLSFVGVMATSGSTTDLGLHYFKASKDFMVFALFSIGLEENLKYSWFSIARYRPSISESWKIYSSLELFTSFLQENHSVSIQRIRLGLEYSNFQFGLASNLGQVTNNFTRLASNLGLFIRKEF